MEHRPRRGAILGSAAVESDPAPSAPSAPGGADAGPSPRRPRDAVATRLRLLDAAEGEFAARGFAGARLREIADAAGVQPALIHHYFTDKYGLYRAVLDRALLPTSTETLGLLASRSDLEGLLEGIVELLLRFYAAHKNLLAILRHEALGGSTVMDEVCRERTAPIIAAVSAMIAEKQRIGELRADVDAGDIVLAGMSMAAYPFVETKLFEIVLPGHVRTDDASLDRRKKAIVAILLGGLRA